MRCTSNFRIKINRSIFLNFFIVPPPPIIGRDEPNNTSMTLTILIIAQSIRTVYMNLLPIRTGNQAKHKFVNDTASK